MRRVAVFLAALLLLAAPAAAQTPAQVDSAQIDSLLADLIDGRKDAVSSRGFIRASETQLTKIVDRFDALIARVRALLERFGSPPDTVPPDTVPPDTTPEPPDTVPEEPDEPEPPAEPEPGAWATGRWALRANGQPIALDFDAARLELPMGMGVVTVSTSLSADTARLTFQVPVYGAGVMQLVHTAGTVAGTMTVAGQSAQVTGERVVVPRPIIDLDTVAPAPRIGLRYDSVRVVVPSATVDARGSLVLAPGESVAVCAVGWSDGRLYLMPGEDVEAHSFGDDHIVTIEFGPGFPTECMRRGAGPSPFSTFLAVRVE